MAEALLRLGELLQAVEPEVEVLRGHARAQALVEVAGQVVAALRTRESRVNQNRGLSPSGTWSLGAGISVLE